LNFALIHVFQTKRALGQTLIINAGKDVTDSMSSVSL